MQQTLNQILGISGVGLHSGAAVAMTMKPARADHGIVFVRADVRDRNNVIVARWDNVVDTRLCTVIGNDAGVTVGTVEHLMAALRGCGIDNLLVEIDGPEVPVMDGSSAAFVAGIDSVGVRPQSAPRRAIKIVKEVVLEHDGKRVRLKPSESSVFGGQIDFRHPMIGNQYFEATLYNGNFRHELAEARTFGFVEEVEAMRKMGLARGGSLDNAVVLDSDKVLNAEGLRFSDEFIRHKLLDAVGDLYLAGGPIIGAYEGFKAGHAMNNAILHELFAQPDAFVMVDQFDEEAAIPSPIPALAAGKRVSAIA